MPKEEPWGGKARASGWGRRQAGDRGGPVAEACGPSQTVRGGCRRVIPHRHWDITLAHSPHLPAVTPAVLSPSGWTTRPSSRAW